MVAIRGIVRGTSLLTLGATLAVAGPAFAQDAADSESIVVTAQRNNQTKVTGGGNVGVFGTKAAEDIPFNIRSYNEALILNQQPDTLGEVLENDPTVRTTLGFGISGGSGRAVGPPVSGPPPPIVPLVLPPSGAD